MAIPGRSTVRKEISVDLNWPDDLKHKNVNARWKSDELGRNIVEVGFTGKTGKTTKRRGRLIENYEMVEEWYDVANPVVDQRTGNLLGYEGGTIEAALKVFNESVVPRVRELFEDGEDVYPTEPEEEDVEDGVLATSVDPLPLTGTRLTIKGKRVKA